MTMCQQFVVALVVAVGLVVVVVLFVAVGLVVAVVSLGLVGLVALELLVLSLR